MNPLAAIVDLQAFPLQSKNFRNECRNVLDREGALVLPDFLGANAVDSIRQESLRQQHLAYFAVDEHNVFLTPADGTFSMDHPRNRLIASSKGCITDDQISSTSPLRTLYDADSFQAFLCAVLGETQLHPYADPMSSINMHYAAAGQELGWHFDNSSFAITLLIQRPVAGGEFEYVKDVRDADRGEMNFDRVDSVLNGNETPQQLAIEPGALVLFRGRNSMHRVTPSAGDRTRMLAVLAYNTKPGVSLSESARMTFYGRLT